MVRWFRNSRRARRKLIDKAVAAANARDFVALGECLAPDLTYVDVAGSCISGRAVYLEAQRALFRQAPDLWVEIGEVGFSRDTMILHGRFVSQNIAFCSPCTWNVRFRDDRICALETFRDHNAISLNGILRRERARQPESAAA